MLINAFLHKVVYSVMYMQKPVFHLGLEKREHTLLL